MFDKLNELYQKAILDHSKAPRNFRRLPEANCTGEGHNPLCGDRFTVFLKIENNVIQDISFQGSGCSISKAAASMMTEALKGKTNTEARAAFEKYKGLLHTGRVEEGETSEWRVFSSLHKFPMRVKCALLPWEAAAASWKESRVS